MTDNRTPIGFTSTGQFVFAEAAPPPRSLTVGVLRAALTDLPDDMPVVIHTGEWPYVIEPEEARVAPSALDGLGDLVEVGHANISFADQACLVIE